jgi:hypothetical protein
LREYQTVVQLGVEDEEDIFAKSYENILLLVFLDIQENLNKEKSRTLLHAGTESHRMTISYKKEKSLDTI